MTYLSGAVLIDSLLPTSRAEAAASWPSGDPAFEHIEVGPGRMSYRRAAGGREDRRSSVRWTVGMLLSNPGLRVILANVEMPPTRC